MKNKFISLLLALQPELSMREPKACLSLQKTLTILKLQLLPRKSVTPNGNSILSPKVRKFSQ